MSCEPVHRFTMSKVMTLSFWVSIIHKIKRTSEKRQVLLLVIRNMSEVTV